MKLAILKTDAVRPEWVPQYGEFPQMFEELFAPRASHWRFTTFDVERGVYPEDPSEYDAFLITGSKSSVYEDKTWIRDLLRFIRQLHRWRKKTVGICFGHQAIALALGGTVEKAAAGWGVGLHTHRFTRMPSWHDQGAAEVAVLVSHQDQVINPPPGAEVLAESGFCPNAVCAIGNHILTFQGHPEFINGYSRVLIEYRRQLIGESVYQQGMASLAELPERDRMADWIIRFVEG